MHVYAYIEYDEVVIEFTCDKFVTYVRFSEEDLEEFIVLLTKKLIELKAKLQKKS